MVTMNYARIIRRKKDRKRFMHRAIAFAGACFNCFSVQYDNFSVIIVNYAGKLKLSRCKAYGFTPATDRDGQLLMGQVNCLAADSVGGGQQAPTVLLGDRVEARADNVLRGLLHDSLHILQSRHPKLRRSFEYVEHDISLDAIGTAGRQHRCGG